VLLAAGVAAVVAGAGVGDGALTALELEAWAASESASGAGTFIVPVAIGAVVFDAVVIVESAEGAVGGVIWPVGVAVGAGATTVLGVGAYFSTIFKKASASAGGVTCPFKTE
jgi:hypothetical protein